MLTMLLVCSCSPSSTDPSRPDTSTSEPTDASDTATPAAFDAEHTHVASLIGTDDFRISRVYRTGFEDPGDFFGSFVVPSPYLGTSYGELSEARVLSGKRAHHGWMKGVNEVVAGTNTNHRAYPTFQFQRTPLGAFQGRVLVELSVWLDATPQLGTDRDWFSFATLCSYGDDVWGRVYNLNVDADGHVYLMHVPKQGQSVHDIFQTKTLVFPQKTWVRLSLFVDYSSDNAHESPYVQAFQDGVLVSAATFDPRLDPTAVDKSLWPPCLSGWDGAKIEDAEKLCGLKWVGGLTQAHFGLYAPPLMDHGEAYNDDLVVYELSH